MSEATQIVTAVGRVVWGNPLIGRPRIDDETKQPKLDSNGAPMTEFSFGLAIEKAKCAELFAAMQTEAAKLFPNGAPPAFAWKFIDGDGMDNKGRPYAEREGYAGCIVLAISTSLDSGIQVVKRENGAFVAIDKMQTGDYVRAGLSIKAHNGNPRKANSKPGLYLNPLLVEFAGFGQPIVRGPDAEALFGDQPLELPAGASTVPVVSAPMPGAPAAPAMPMAGIPAQTTAAPAPAMQAPMTGAPMGNPQTVAVPGMMPNAGPAGVSAPPVSAPTVPAQLPGSAALPGTQTVSPSNPAAPAGAPAAPDYVGQVTGGAIPGFPGVQAA